ncbi:MAG: A/G-specific adenine glycosylase [Anaerolineaceae bacterium]|nr:A/G-specific adenine glycosylase [Anaerolineaceae bacterium]
MTFHPITKNLLSWYQKNARQLPWRAIASPYRTFVSEIMLQQTRVETVLPYFERWMQTFPDINALASADEQLVLKMWEGLGYYSRARNLHKAAKLIVEKHNGQLPSSIEDLQKLPGIGPYTAGAIASIAFDQPAIAIDGNIRRVISRLSKITSTLSTPEFENACQETLKDLLPKTHAGDFNQALMDLGATICTPKSPVCSDCPLRKFCQAYSAGVQAQLPYRKRKAAVPHHIVTAGVISQNHQVLLCQRPNNALLGGLWEFPGGKLEKDETLAEALMRELVEELQIQVAVKQPIGVYDHAFTHFKITLHAFFCDILSGEPTPTEAQNMQWVSLQDIEQYPMGKVDRLIANQLKKL